MKTKLFFNFYFFGFILLFTSFIILSCTSNEPKVEDKSDFGIYLLEDPSITWESLIGKNLDQYKLKTWITSNMIDSVDFSSQVFYLNVNYNTLLSVAHNDNTPFVVVANNKRCYCGQFGPPMDTTQPCVTFTPMALCTDLVMLEFNPPQRKDIRINEDVKSALKSLGKLRLGISLQLNSLQLWNGFAPRFVRVVVDRFNNEDNYIYAKGNKWDIIKAGNKTYESKLVIYGQSLYFSIPVNISPLDSLNYKTKTIIDPEIGYSSSSFLPFLKNERFSDACSDHYLPDNLPKGTYYCFLEYYGGMMGGNKTMRYTPNGRMWMGYMRSNTIQIEYISSGSVKEINVLNANVVLN